MILDQGPEVFHCIIVAEIFDVSLQFSSAIPAVQMKKYGSGYDNKCDPLAVTGHRHWSESCTVGNSISAIERMQAWDQYYISCGYFC